MCDEANIGLENSSLTTSPSVSFWLCCECVVFTVYCSDLSPVWCLGTVAFGFRPAAGQARSDLPFCYSLYYYISVCRRNLESGLALRSGAVGSRNLLYRSKPVIRHMPLPSESPAKRDILRANDVAQPNKITMSMSGVPSYAKPSWTLKENSYLFEISFPILWIGMLLEHPPLCIARFDTMDTKPMSGARKPKS